MLLYDRVCEFARRSGRDPGIYRDLRRMPVYELSNVIPLFDDWNREKNRPIPKRPPHPRVWAEWRKDLEGMGVMTCGAAVTDVSMIAPLDGADERYCVYLFGRLESLRPGVPSNLPVGAVYQVAGCVHVGLADGACRVTFGYNRISNDRIMFGLAAVELGFQEENVSLLMGWAPFMAFALLHCKNVVTEDVPPAEHVQSECRKHGRPERVTYKVLRVEAPKVARPGRPDRTPGDGRPHVRFHLCSGHFKNLQHPRYLNKGWHWWPAHWRGSRSLGRVEKRYEVVPPQKG